MAVDTEHYPPSLCVLHWLMAVMLLLGMGIGFFVNDLPSDLRADAWRLHKSLGMTFGFLWMARITIRQVSQLPQPVGTTLERHVQRVAHKLLYAAMALMVLSGYGMRAFKDKPVTMWGLEIPSILPTDPKLASLARQAHEPLAYLLLILLALHIAGAIKHIAVNRHNLITRIT